jgi:hypothetical protein
MEDEKGAKLLRLGGYLRFFVLRGLARKHRMGKTYRVIKVIRIISGSFI